MHDFRYVGNKLYCEGVALEALAKKFGTPLYVYSQRTLTSHFQQLDRAMACVDHLVCFAVKSNSNQSVLRALARLGSGFDIVSGIAFENIEGVYARASKLKNLRLRGVQMHIGSQITEVNPFEQAVRKALPLVTRLKEQHGLEFFSIGGGLGIVYKPALASGSANWWKSAEAKNILTPQKYADRLAPVLKSLGLRILMEPGRFISGSAGVLVTRVEYVKR